MQDLVSVIIPCFNEEKNIAQTLNALVQQTYPPDCLEILVIDGLSTDRTRAIVTDYANAHPQTNLRLLDNQRRIIPAALNIGIQRAKGDYIVRVDAHVIPSNNYVQRCVELLQSGIADNVGGCLTYALADDSPVARAISYAIGHPFGVGDALYRYAQKAVFVDTVPFGAYMRTLFDKVGLYDEELQTNEDYDLNYRIRRGGGKVYLSPDIVSTYIPRSSFSALANQYYRYGWWKVKMLRKYPSSLRWRQMVPPAFVVAFVTLGIGSLIAWPLAFLWFALMAIYLSMCAIVTAQIMRRRRCGLRVGVFLPWAFVVVHFSWGLGFGASLLTQLLRVSGDD